MDYIKISNVKFVSLTHQKPFPPVTPKKSPVERLKAAMEKAQKGIDVSINIAVMGKFILVENDELIVLDDYFDAIILGDALYLVSGSREDFGRRIEIKQTIYSLYRLYVLA